MLPIVLSIKQDLNSIVPSIVSPIVLSVRPDINFFVPSTVPTLSVLTKVVLCSN